MICIGSPRSRAKGLINATKKLSRRPREDGNEKNKYPSRITHSPKLDFRIDHKRPSLRMSNFDDLSIFDSRRTKIDSDYKRITKELDEIRKRLNGPITLDRNSIRSIPEKRKWRVYPDISVTEAINAALKKEVAKKPTGTSPREAIRKATKLITQ